MQSTLSYSSFSAANGKQKGVAKKLQNEESSSEEESEEEEAPKKAEGNI